MLDEMIISKRIGRVTLKVQTEMDLWPDLSHLGEFSSEWEEHAIETNAGPRGFPYFCPANPEYAEQDYERIKAYNNNEWCMMVIKAEVAIDGRVLGDDLIGGIESDSAEVYIKNYGYDLGRNAIREARMFINKLCEGSNGNGKV